MLEKLMQLFLFHFLFVIHLTLHLNYLFQVHFLPYISLMNILFYHNQILQYILHQICTAMFFSF